MKDLNVIVNAKLASLDEWLRGNKLSLNVIKTQAMTIGSKQKLSQIKKSSSVNPSFNERNDDIGFVNETKYLGIMIDDNLNWDSQIKNIQTKISRALGLLKYAERYVPISTLNDMYKQGRLPWRGYRGSCPSCPRSGGAEGASSAFKYSL